MNEDTPNTKKLKVKIIERVDERTVRDETATADHELDGRSSDKLNVGGEYKLF